MTIIDLDNTQPGTIPHDFVDTECEVPLISAREWMSLGALCAEAADKMKAEGQHIAAKRYAALARKCDRMVDES